VCVESLAIPLVCVESLAIPLVCVESLAIPLVCVESLLLVSVSEYIRCTALVYSVYSMGWMLSCLSSMSMIYVYHIFYGVDAFTDVCVQDGLLTYMSHVSYNDIHERVYRMVC
jgi:hypothetical protein